MPERAQLGESLAWHQTSRFNLAAATLAFPNPFQHQFAYSQVTGHVRTGPHFSDKRVCQDLSPRSNENGFAQPGPGNQTTTDSSRSLESSCENLAYRSECFHCPLLEPPADLLEGDLLFSIDSSSSADNGGDTSPPSTIAFASTAFP